MELNKKKVSELVEIAKSLGIENPTSFKKAELINLISKNDGSFTGILEILPSKYGFLRNVDFDFSDDSNDVYVSESLIKRFALRFGDVITGIIQVKEGKANCLVNISSINGKNPHSLAKRPLFDNLTPVYPKDIFKFEYDRRKRTGRYVDLFSPMGKGQRGLIVAPPKTGKTEFLKELAHGIERNHPEVILFVLLVDERPEEVTDMQRSVKGEVYASTFDLPAINHVKVSEMLIEKAKRLVEEKKDVVILMDSITRLARAYNTVTPSSGKVLSGGVDASALQKPKRFFGAARKIEEGGSLTIVSTALIETGSKMDEVIFEEFKGTGNSEIVLNRGLSNKRIFPAIDILKSGTRKEELLMSASDLSKIWSIRNMVSNISEFEAVKLINGKLDSSKTNKEFFDLLK